MSHNCYSDIVPFVKHCFFEGDPNKDRQASKLFNTDCYLEGECDWQWDFSDEDISNITNQKLVVNDWTHMGYVNFGKRGYIYASLWTKDDSQKVWIVNSSQYSNVGEFDMAIMANDRTSVVEFSKDFSHLMTTDIPIEETDVVQCWS